MKIKIISQCLVSGNVAKVGDVLELGDKVSRDLIAMERAVPYKEEPKAAPAQEQKKPEGKARG